MITYLLFVVAVAVAIALTAFNALVAVFAILVSAFLTVIAIAVVFLDPAITATATLITLVFDRPTGIRHTVAFHLTGRTVDGGVYIDPVSISNDTVYGGLRTEPLDLNLERLE